jgi:hypothetical protein
MSENKIRSLTPYIARLTWTWARRAIICTREKSTKNRKVNRLVKLAADRGDPEAQWWMSHSLQIVTMAVNKPDHYSDDDLMRAKYHYYLYCGTIVSIVGHLKEAAEWGHADSVLEYAEWLARTAVTDATVMEMLKKAATMGSVYALKELKVKLDSHRASIEERALNGCYEAAAYLTEYETDTGRDPLLVSNSGKECTANDALWRFLFLFSGLLHPTIGKNRYLDNEIEEVISTINGSGARYQFGLCTHQLIDVIPRDVVQLFMPYVLQYRQTSERAKEAVLTWTLVGHRLGVCHNMRKFIGEMIWADRVEWMMIKASPAESEESPKKRPKN